MVHTLFSIVAPIRHGRQPRVSEPDLAFGDLPTLHFASVVVFDEPAGAVPGAYPPHVVFESCIDGTLEDNLAALVFEPRRRAAVASLFQNCDAFAVTRTAQGDFNAQELIDYLRAHVVRPHLFHIGTPGLRLDHIRAGAGTARRAGSRDRETRADRHRA